MLLVSMWTTTSLNGSLLDQLFKSKADMKLSLDISAQCGRALDSKTEELDRKIRGIANLRKQVEKVNGDTLKITTEIEDSKTNLDQEKTEKQTFVDQNSMLQKQISDTNMTIQKNKAEIKSLEFAIIKLEDNKKVKKIEGAKNLKKDKMIRSASQVSNGKYATKEEGSNLTNTAYIIMAPVRGQNTYDNGTEKNQVPTTVLPKEVEKVERENMSDTNLKKVEKTNNDKEEEVRKEVKGTEIEDLDW